MNAFETINVPYGVTIRDCSVVVIGATCTLCGLKLKCITDVDLHSSWRHGTIRTWSKNHLTKNKDVIKQLIHGEKRNANCEDKRSEKKMRLILKVGNEVILDKRVKRKYLMIRQSISRGTQTEYQHDDEFITAKTKYESHAKDIDPLNLWSNNVLKSNIDDRFEEDSPPVRQHRCHYEDRRDLSDNFERNGKSVRLLCMESPEYRLSADRYDDNEWIGANPWHGGATNDAMCIYNAKDLERQNEENEGLAFLYGRTRFVESADEITKNSALMRSVWRDDRERQEEYSRNDSNASIEISSASTAEDSYDDEVQEVLQITRRKSLSYATTDRSMSGTEVNSRKNREHSFDPGLKRYITDEDGIFVEEHIVTVKSDIFEIDDDDEKVNVASRLSNAGDVINRLKMSPVNLKKDLEYDIMYYLN